MQKLLCFPLWLGFLLLACAAPDQSDALSQEEKEPPIVLAAKKDLAQKLNVEAQTIELIGPVEEVTWPDSSLGCPEPGMMYAQVLTPGYRFKLQSGGKIYEYHASKRSVKLCKR